MQMHVFSFKFFAFSEEAVGDEGKKIEAVQSNLSQLMANTDNKMHQLEEVFEPKAVRELELIDKPLDSIVHSGSNSLLRNWMSANIIQVTNRQQLQLKVNRIASFVSGDRISNPQTLCFQCHFPRLSAWKVRKTKPRSSSWMTGYLFPTCSNSANSVVIQ